MIVFVERVCSGDGVGLVLRLGFARSGEDERGEGTCGV